MGIAEDLEQRLSSGEIIVIDGGIGTELQARGIAMDAGTWCGAANLDLGAVQSVHESYIDVGVDLITTNTFSTNRAALEWGGLGDRVEEVNRSAVKAALQARDAAATRPIAIAGSMSPFCSITVQVTALAERRPTADTFEAGDPRRPTLAHYREQATILAEAGVDLIVLEMMNSPSDGLAAIEAATETGLPVWLGLSPSRLGDGSLGTVEEPGNHPDFEELVMLLVHPGLAAVNVMHAKIAVVAECNRRRPTPLRWTGRRLCRVRRLEPSELGLHRRTTRRLSGGGHGLGVARGANHWWMLRHTSGAHRSARCRIAEGTRT